MAEEKKDSKSKVIIIILLIVIILLIGGGVTAFVILSNNGNSDQPEITSPVITTADGQTKNPLALDYDNSAVALDENGLEKQLENLQKNAGNNISLEYRNEVVSEDGKVFKCYLANSELNTEDMFIAIFTDSDMTEQVYLSGLLRPGTSIQEFQSEIPFETGEYSVVAMFTSVSDDHETMTSQIAVELKLTVQ
jgi:hypothetical protein